MEKTTLSQTVKKLRKEYGLTQEELAMKSGVGLNFVRQLEQGKPTLPNLQFAEAEGFEPSEPCSSAR